MKESRKIGKKELRKKEVKEGRRTVERNKGRKEGTKEEIT